MYLYDFLDFNNYPVRVPTQFQKAFRDFLMAPYMCPYYAGIGRVKPSLIKEIQDKIKRLFEDFKSILPKEKWVEIKDYSDMWDELSGKYRFDPVSKELKYTFDMFDMVSRRFLLTTKIKKELDEINEFVVENGKECLEQEHQIGLEIAFRDETKFYEFTEYVAICWNNTNVESHEDSIYQLDIRQLENYLAYFECYIGHFRSADEYCENNKQAVQAIEQIIKCKAHIRNIDIELRAASSALVHLQNRLDELIDITRKIDERSISLLQKFLDPKNECQTESYPTSPEDTRKIEEEVLKELGIQENITNIRDEMSKLYVEIKDKKNYMQKLYTTGINKPDGTLDTLNYLYKNIKTCSNYWIQEIPRIKARQYDIEKIKRFSTISRTSGSYDMIYRNITEKEVDSLKANYTFLQSAKSLEREKWFYLAAANPGAGVSHDYKCTIYLKKGAIDLLLELQKPDGSFACIVKKEAEPGCFGVHEDGLLFFSEMISHVEIIGKSGEKPIASLDFSKNNANKKMRKEKLEAQFEEERDAINPLGSSKKIEKITNKFLKSQEPNNYSSQVQGADLSLSQTVTYLFGSFTRRETEEILNQPNPNVRLPNLRS